MATTINADTSNGLVVTPDTSGVLELQSNGVTVLKVDSPTGSLTIPVGTTAERPVSPTVGMMRYNTTEAYYEQYDGSAWVEAGGSAYDAPTTSTGYFALPTGTTAQRPGSPTVGMIRYNTTESSYEQYNGTEWGQIVTLLYPYSVEFILIAGGGGGGFRHAGGGGAGGMIYGTQTVLASTGYGIVIGAGGPYDNDGNNSSVFGSTCVAGGKGGRDTGTRYGNPGGSGGGDGEQSNRATGGAGTAGQGNAGGGATSVYGGGGGGGGKGQAGGKGATPTGTAGNGGNGINTYATWAAATSSGANTGYYAGGGGGGGYQVNIRGAGGLGGGGQGGEDGTPGVDAVVNTGGGGGGGGQINAGNYGGTGGSGIVIIRYLGSQKGTGGTVYSSGGYTYHKFTSSGTYTG